MKKNQAAVSVSFVSLGCFKNLVDTEVLGGMLQEKGIRIISAYEKSDWVIINTCGFIRDAKEESIEEIFKALEKKEKGEISHIAVLGCLPQRYHNELKENYKNVDIIWGVNDLQELAGLIIENKRGEYQDKNLFIYNHTHKRIITTTINVSYIKISEGCNMTCSFCAIPQIRGPYRSRSIDSIINEAIQLKERGVEEINLISQNSTHFGFDRSSRSELPILLKQISDLKFRWVRILYLMPEEINNEILAAFGYPSILPYFDLPFQHVSPSILKKMNRKNDYHDKIKLVKKIRAMYAQAVIRSTFIVGFPGETETDFDLLARFARESEIERIGVFSYSSEDGTQAFKFKDSVPEETKTERREYLMDISDENILHYNQSQLNSIHEFIPLGPCSWDNQKTIGRIESQSPDTDGLTVLDTKFTDNTRIAKITITGSDHELLFGEKP